MVSSHCPRQLLRPSGAPGLSVICLCIKLVSFEHGIYVSKYLKLDQNQQILILQSYGRISYPETALSLFLW
jgi:hypothetical protein